MVAVDCYQAHLQETEMLTTLITSESIYQMVVKTKNIDDSPFL